MSLPSAAARRRLPASTTSGVLDAALLTLFAVIGRASHHESLDLAGVATTAWPFLVGTLTGWLVLRAWRTPLAIWPAGVGIWAATLVIGMLLRAASGQGVQVAFIIVAAVTLALFLIGWRVASRLGRWRRR
ncbi:MAG TPA: DUF3054 domain-containing protein [Candidatus Lumbricidophila sp.]|nr:DUF3054 domain-containing protein [Candidatus Lumbricidophila sp.]